MAERLNAVGVGIGPFNLSLAALLDPLPALRSRFYERQPSFHWHPGMLLPGSRMQTSFLKDLVTPVDPTSRFGFLSYLVSRGLLYRFLNADYPRILRAEYAGYLRWVADQLPSLAFGREVREVTAEDGGFRVVLDDSERVPTEHLVVATGLVPHLPPGAEAVLGPDCLHSHGYVTSELLIDDRHIMLVGGGQSSAEIFLDLLSGRRGRPRRVTWLTRRNNLSPLDETPFTNEYFTPSFVRSFHGLPEPRRRSIVPQQKLAGDGISPLTLGEIYQRLYELDGLGLDGPAYAILPDRDVRRLRRGVGFEVETYDAFREREERWDADAVILATGYRYRLPSCLEPLAQRFERDGDGYPKLRADYSVLWDGPARHRIYMQNAGHRSHGIADAQLSLAAWRAAVICNGIAGHDVYQTDAMPAMLRWQPETAAQAQRERAARSPNGVEREGASKPEALTRATPSGARPEPPSTWTAPSPRGGALPAESSSR
jgi:lysine N6-hydroxylase